MSENRIRIKKNPYDIEYNCTSGVYCLLYMKNCGFNFLNFNKVFNANAVSLGKREYIDTWQKGDFSLY